MPKKESTIDFPTNRDKFAFGQILKRTNLSFAKGELQRIEVISNRLASNCDNCQEGFADLRLTWKYGEGKYGSDDYCLKCFREETMGWVFNILIDLENQTHRYRFLQQNKAAGDD